jgi:hypothetical protein
MNWATIRYRDFYDVPRIFIRLSMESSIFSIARSMMSLTTTRIAIEYINFLQSWKMSLKGRGSVWRNGRSRCSGQFR